MGNATKETELPEYLKKLILEKFIFGVTYALISVLLMVLLFMSHTNILSEIMVQSLPRGTEEKALWVWQKVVVKWIIGNGVNMSSTLKKKKLFIAFREGERRRRGREKHRFVHFFMQSLAGSCVCPDGGQNLQPPRIGMTLWPAAPRRGWALLLSHHYVKDSVAELAKALILKNAKYLYDVTLCFQIRLLDSKRWILWEMRHVGVFF